MLKMTMTKLAAAAIIGLVSAQASQAAMSLKVNERVFNDFPDSTLVVTTDNATSAVFDESAFGTGGYANRHDVVGSGPGLQGDAIVPITDPFTIEANVTLSAIDVDAEAGLRINSPVTGDAIFLIKSNGEIAAFGGGAPFYSFASSGDADAYVPGSTIFMKMVYTPGGALFVPGTVEYIIDRGNGLESSGVMNWENLEGGPTNHTVGVYTQGHPTAPESTSAVTTAFNNVVLTPEPTSLALLGLGGLTMLRRRQR